MEGGRRILVACLGDSITAGSPLWDPDPAVRAGILEPDPRSQYEHWADLADPRLELRNCGIFGQRTDEIARRLDACADGAEVLVVQGGINDIAQSRSVERAADHLAGMIERGRELGLAVALANVLPWNNGYPRADEPIRRLNALIAELDIQVLPFFETLEDSERPGRMREEWTDDGDHPSIEGYRRLGELAFSLPALR
jgi:lysophospholipase L1-like esterase